MATGGSEELPPPTPPDSPPAIVGDRAALLRCNGRSSGTNNSLRRNDPDDRSDNGNDDDSDSEARGASNHSAGGPFRQHRRDQFVEPSDSEFSDSERLRPTLKSRSPSPPVRRRKPCLVQRSFDSDAEFWVSAGPANAAAAASAEASSSRPPSALKNSGPSGGGGGGGGGGWRRRDSDAAERRQSRRQSEENGGIELIGSLRPSDLTMPLDGASSNSRRRILNITLSDGSRFAADPAHFRRYPNSLLGRLAAVDPVAAGADAGADDRCPTQEWCHLPDGVTLDAFRALLGLYSDEGRIRWRPAYGALAAAAAAASSAAATATESRRSSDATTATSIAAAAAVALSASSGYASVSASASASASAAAPTPGELRLACRLLELPFAPDAMRGCPDLRGLLHEISNDGARERFALFLEEAILPLLASCAHRGERECQLVVLADDDVVDWDSDNPPQMADWDLEPVIVRSTAMCRFLKYVENRDVAKQVLRHRRLKKIRIGIEGYPTRMESVKRRAGGRADAIYSYAQRPFMRVSWEKEENRHVDFQCVVQVKNDAASDNGGGLQAAAVERPVDLPPSLTPPLPGGGGGGGGGGGPPNGEPNFDVNPDD